MELFEKLPHNDVKLINGYINHYGGGDENGSYMPLDRMSYFLRFWSKNKAPLYAMFGEQFIIKKEVCFNKDVGTMEEEMYDRVQYGDSIWKSFAYKYKVFVDNLTELDYDDRYELRRFVDDYGMLIKNEYMGDPITIPSRVTVDNHPLQINKGAKAIKMLGKICKAIGYEHIQYKCPHCGTYIDSDRYEPYQCPYCYSNETRYVKVDGYESFRRMHSLILNQKVLRGKLCLSIHPLDYITMSDNESGWQSCMQWMDEQGDYRLGTIEMMNSPYCVVAYMEAHEDMALWDGTVRWNNKHWRQLLMITPEMLLGNKQYPYFSDDLQGTSMKWLRELANVGDFRCVENNKRYGPYSEEALQIRNQRWNKVGLQDIYVHFWFDYMYNDIYDSRMAFISRYFSSDRIEYNLSGPAVCTTCGERIYKDYDTEVEPHWTTCRDCNNMWKCACCGEWHCGEAYYAEDSDNPYCFYCYDTNLDRCEVCGSRVVNTEAIFIRLLPEADDEYECFNWNYVIDVCKYCVKSSDFKQLFGDIYTVSDMFGRDRSVVFVTNFSDDAFSCGELDASSRNLLRLLRDAKSDEERLNLIQKNLC